MAVCVRARQRKRERGSGDENHLFAHNNLRVSDPLESTAWLDELDEGWRGGGREQREGTSGCRGSKKRAEPHMYAYIIFPTRLWWDLVSYRRPRQSFLSSVSVFFCLSPDFTSFTVFDLHNILYACAAINQSHSPRRRLSMQFSPIYLQMVIWHAWIGSGGCQEDALFSFVKYSVFTQRFPHQHKLYIQNKVGVDLKNVNTRLVMD